MMFICPECGICLDSTKVDFRKHAKIHYGVEPRDMDRLRNSEAVRRYNLLLEAAEKADLEKDQVSPKIADIKEHVKKMEEK